MVRFASDEIRPVKAIFYDDLDTVRFGNDATEVERKSRGLTAMGSIMVSVLAGNIAPILSQSQSYDNQLLLTLISSEGSLADRDDRLAFLQLARAGFVRVGLMQKRASGSSPDRERYTLMNAFRASLANREFVLSGWPELNSDLDLRDEVLGCLDRAPGGRMSAAVPASVAARVEGLREFDRNLGQAPQGISVVPPAGGDPLEARVNGMLQTRADGDAVRDAASVLITRAQRDRLSLDSRSSWYRLIDWNAHQPDSAPASALQVLRDIVDLNYNAMVSESLSDDGMSLSAGHEDAADTAAEEFTPGQLPGKRWAELSPTLGKGDWLHWSNIPELLPKLQVLSTEERLTELGKRQGEQIIRYEEAHSWGVSIRTALWGAAGMALSTSAGALTTGAAPGPAAGAGAIAGTVTLVAGTPAARAIRARSMAREEERLRRRDERSAIRTGAAGWLERTRRRP